MAPHGWRRKLGVYQISWLAQGQVTKITLLRVIPTMTFILSGNLDLPRGRGEGARSRTLFAPWLLARAARGAVPVEAPLQAALVRPVVAGAALPPVAAVVAALPLLALALAPAALPLLASTPAALWALAPVALPPDALRPLLRLLRRGAAPAPAHRRGCGVRGACAAQPRGATHRGAAP